MFHQGLFPSFADREDLIASVQRRFELSCIGSDFSFKEIQSSSGLLLFLWIYYPKFLLKALWIFVSFVLKTAEIYSLLSGIYILSLSPSTLKQLQSLVMS